MRKQHMCSASDKWQAPWVLGLGVGGRVEGHLSSTWRLNRLKACPARPITKTQRVSCSELQILEFPVKQIVHERKRKRAGTEKDTRLLNIIGARDI